MEKIISVYLSVAGFLLKINFHPTKVISEKNKFIEMILTDFRGFVYKPGKNIITPDFFIEVRPPDSYMFINKEINAFTKLYTRSDSKNKISTYYSISCYQFRIILMKILDDLLAGNGFIVHCSAVKLNNKAVLFFANSGGGKSTVSLFLSRYYKVLADDSGIIRKNRGNYYFYQSPNLEKNDFIIKNSNRYDLTAVFLLNKAPYYKIVKKQKKQFIFKKISEQLLGVCVTLDNKIKMKFLLKMSYEFKEFYSLYFGLDGTKLNRLLENEGIC